MNLGDWIPVAVALAAAVPGILAYVGQRRKVRAEEADIYTGAARKLIESLTTRLEAVTGRMDKLEVDLRKARDDFDAADAELTKARVQLELMEKSYARMTDAVRVILDGVASLVAQLNALGIVPAWTPPPSLVADLNAMVMRKA
jgi:outer membrane murein-binding lipoprotein Lpp